MDTATRALVNSALMVVFGSVLTFLAAWFWWRKNAAVNEARRLAIEHSDLTQRVVDLETQLAGVKQSVVPINAAFQAILIKELTHFHTPRMDELMSRIGPPVELTDAEERELADLLAARAHDMDGRISDSERDAATLLPLVIKRVRVEADVPGPVELAVVALPVEPEPTEPIAEG